MLKIVRQEWRGPIKSAQYDSGTLARLIDVMTAWGGGTQLSRQVFAAHFLVQATNDPIGEAANKLAHARGEPYHCESWGRRCSRRGTDEPVGSRQRNDSALNAVLAGQPR
jgi:hypothetical protein